VPSQDLRPLVEKLNTTCRKALEAAAGLCLSRTHYHVEVEHWLLKLLEVDQSDFKPIFKHYEIDSDKVQRQLTAALDDMRTGNGRSPDLSLEVLDLMREAWSLASLDYNSPRLRSGILLAALLNNRILALRMGSASPELSKIPAVQLRSDLPALLEISEEEPTDSPSGTASAGAASSAGEPKPASAKSNEALKQYTLNLTQRAREGQIDPVIGRDFEIRQVIDILTRRRQNNPILTGEAGVGKTAVVEGFALRVANGDVPKSLEKIEIHTLDLGLLQAGAGIKGEFENRLKSVIAEVKASPVPIILFIDEAHTLIGAGQAPGQGDAANLLKPALARGELRTIAATTWMEYKKSFETDAALKRRFQVVKVEEPDEQKAIQMVRGLAPTLEKHHGVRILEDAVDDAVKLSFRYIPDRQLPDKAISLLDTTCARVALSQSATPPLLEDSRREIEMLDAEISALRRDDCIGEQHQARLEELLQRREEAQAELVELEKRCEQEKAIVEQIREVTRQLEDVEIGDTAETATTEAAATDSTTTAATQDGKAASPTISATSAAPAESARSTAVLDAGPGDSDDDRNRLRAKLSQLKEQLADLQGERPLVHPVVDRNAVADVVSGWTGIPVGKMVLDEIKTVLELKERLENRVIGQSHALEAIAQRINTSRAALADPTRPIGVFMLVGPSGVGKTETALALADILYGGERSMVVINMSEYKEEHKISRLTGSAPGYVGYGEGGVLTEAVRRKPYCVVLLDEVEKAHPSVQEIFYQVFDKGMLQDDKGNEIDFKNTIILLTSNAASDTIMRACRQSGTWPDPEQLVETIRPELLKTFKPALLGRLNIVPYYPLDDDVLKQIIELQFNKIAQRVRQNHQASFKYDPSVVEAIVGRCREVETGARNADHIISGTLLPEVSREVLTRLAEGRAIERVGVQTGDDGRFVYQID
jgi:type VI secretion system protein VasG